MKPLSLDDLPKHSRWPSRLIGLENFDQKNRTIEQIEREYNADKFQKSIDIYEAANGEISARELRFAMTRDDADELRDAVDQGNLVLASLREVTDRRDSIMVDALRDAAERGDTIVELGCAFGFNIAHFLDEFPTTNFVGADYSENAINLAQRLFESEPRARFDRFNFYDARYPVLDQIQGSITVLTAQALEQMPTAEPLISALKQVRSQVSEVVHLEPNHATHDRETTLGLLRARYGDLNDYNRDLLPLLRDDPEIELRSAEAEKIGFNAFNPLTLYRWTFK